MKKVALSLLAFALVGSMAFGQDAPVLKLSGYLNTGVKVIANNTTQSTLYGDDAGANWGRFDLDGSYGTDTNGVVWKLRLQDPFATYVDTFDPVTGAPGQKENYAPGINFAYAWSKFADGLVTVKAGAVDDGTFSTAGDIGGDLTDHTSILVFVTPFAGLNVGASWYLLPVASSAPLSYAFHGAFTSDKLFKAEAGVSISDSKLTEALFGLGVLAVDKLTLTADADITGLGDAYAANGLFKTAQNVSYAVTDAFSAGILAYEYIFGADQKDSAGNTKFGYNVKPNVSYTLDPVIALGANVKYNVGPNSDNKGLVNDAAWITVNPSATFTLSPAAKIIASYALDYSLDKTKWHYGTDPDQVTQHTVKVDFRYNF